MSIWAWILIGFGVLLAILLIFGLLSGVVGIFVALFTAIYHLFIRPDPVPGENDTKWSRDQAREVE